MLTGSYRWNPECHTERMFRAIPREGQHNESVEVGAFATLNYSKLKRISAADVLQHLRSKGVLCPCNDFLACKSEGMASERNNHPMNQGRHETPAPRNRVKV